MNLTACKNFIETFDQVKEPSSGYLIKQETLVDGNLTVAYEKISSKPSSHTFKTQQIVETALECLNYLKRDQIKSSITLEDRVKLLSLLSKSVLDYGKRIEESIKNRWWYCILHFFGYQAQRPESIKDLWDEVCTHLNPLIGQLEDKKREDERRAKQVRIQLHRDQLLQKAKIKAISSAQSLNDVSLNSWNSSYSLKHWEPNSGAPENRRIEDARQEKIYISYLNHLINFQHQKILVEGLPTRFGLAQSPNPAQERILRKFEESFEVIPEDPSSSKCQSYLCPKVKSLTFQENDILNIQHDDMLNIQNHIFNVQYENGVIEEGTILEDGRFQGKRVYSISSKTNLKEIAEGTFCAQGRLEEGYEKYRNSEDIFIYTHAPLSKTVCEYNFVSFRGQLVPVKRQIADAGSRYCYMYSKNNSSLLALAYLAMEDHFDAISAVLKGNSCLSLLDFISYALKTKQNNIPFIFLFKAPSLIGLLKMLSQHENEHKKIFMDSVFQIKHPENNQTLFLSWIGKGQLELLKLMLELKPQLVSTALDCVSQALLREDEEEAKLFSEVTKRQNQSLSPRDQEIEKAYKGNLFVEGRFGELDATLQKDIYRCANLYMHENLVAQLNGLQKREKQEWLFPLGNSILASNMDVIQIRKMLQDFLGNLKSQGILVSKQEAVPDQIAIKTEFGELIYQNYAEQIIQKLQLKHIKIGKSCAIARHSSSIQINIQAIKSKDQDNMDSSLSYIEITCKDLQVLKEEIQPVERKLSREEIEELNKFYEETGFIPDESNTTIARDGIYLTSIQPYSYSPIRYLPVLNNFLKEKVVKEDMQWLEERLSSKFSQLIGFKAEMNANLEKFGFSTKKARSFNFSIQEIFS